MNDVLEKFLGKFVVINWSKHYISRTRKDPVDPDNWNDIGFIAKSTVNGKFALIFHHSSREYINGTIGLVDICDEDIELIVESSSAFPNSDITPITERMMTLHNYSFGVSQQPAVTAIDKSCNTCRHSNLFSLKCKLTANHISNPKDLCQNWAQ